jgi:hypothetical protein
MRTIKEIKILHEEIEINEHLKKGWVILKIFDNGDFVLALRDEV